MFCGAVGAQARPQVLLQCHREGTPATCHKPLPLAAAAAACVRLGHRRRHLQAKASPADDGVQGAPTRGATTSNAVSSSQCSTSRRVLQTDPVQLCELLVRLSQLQVKPHQQWLQDVLDTIQPHLRDLSTAQLSSTLQILGSWAFMPQEPFMQALHTAIMQQRDSMTMRHIADMAWGLAQLQNPKQPLLDHLLQAALDLMQNNKCSVGAMQCLQGQPECSLQAAQPHKQQAQGQQPVCCPASLADLIWAVAKLQHSPGSSWLDTFATTSLPLLTHSTPHQLAQIIWAFARLPYQPGQLWLDSFLAVVREELTRFDSKSVSLTAWGLATLKAQPNPRWLFAFERQAERTLSTLAASELACTLWALSELKDKRADRLRLGRLVRRQEVFWGFDFEALANPRLLRVVRQLTLGPQSSR